MKTQKAVKWESVFVILVLSLIQGATGFAAHKPADHIRDHLQVSRYSLQHLVLPGKTEQPYDFIITVEHEGVEKQLYLQRYSVRAANYKLHIYRDGKYIEQDPGSSRTYRGYVVNDPGSAVTALLDSDGLSAKVYQTGKPRWSIKPLRKADKSAKQNEHIVYNAADELPIPRRARIAGNVGFVYSLWG